MHASDPSNDRHAAHTHTTAKGANAPAHQLTHKTATPHHMRAEHTHIEASARYEGSRSSGRGAPSSHLMQTRNTLPSHSIDSIQAHSPTQVPSWGLFVPPPYTSHPSIVSAGCVAPEPNKTQIQLKIGNK